ncbi:MAG TPA: tetratricopeptide repeat protein [Verrucomicrobiae bacterium]|nr:tetratricopeptide repeat protein [Verrucomicrobiae bacterium]
MQRLGYGRAFATHGPVGARGSPAAGTGSKPPAAIPTARNPQPARASTKSEEFNADAVRQHAAKDVAGALESNEQALKLCPDWPQAVISHADNLFHLRRYDESITEWTHAIELDPGGELRRPACRIPIRAVTSRQSPITRAPSN